MGRRERWRLRLCVGGGAPDMSSRWEQVFSNSAHMNDGRRARGMTSAAPTLGSSGPGTRTKWACFARVGDLARRRASCLKLDEKADPLGALAPTARPPEEKLPIMAAIYSSIAVGLGITAGFWLGKRR